MKPHPVAALLAIVAFAPEAALALPYIETFDVDPSAEWTINDPGLSDVLVDFHYDYSQIGVPPAPGGTTTFGMKLTANNTGGVCSGFSVSPTGRSFSGDFTIRFHLWQNYLGTDDPFDIPRLGTTQLSMFGFGTAGDVPVWPGSLPKESIMLGVTLDGGSALDYRIYDSEHPTGRFQSSGNEVFNAVSSNGDSFGGQNNSHPYYAGFGGESAPAAQVALYPDQTVTTATDPGVLAFAWREVVIDFTGGIVTWSIDGLQIAQFDTSGLDLGGGFLLFGHSDTNTTSSFDPDSHLLNVTLIDNIRVVPEPGTLSLCLAGLTGLALIALRRRASPVSPLAVREADTGT